MCVGQLINSNPQNLLLFELALKKCQKTVISPLRQLGFLVNASHQQTLCDRAGTCTECFPALAFAELLSGL